MAENWYIVLELEFDPSPVHDPAVIAQRIDDKSKFWSSKFNDFNRGAEYRKYHQMIPDIRKAMSDPDERNRLVKEACDLRYGPIDKLIKMIGRKGEITQIELQNIADKQKIDVAAVERRRAALGIKKGTSKDADFQAVYDKYYKTKPQNASVFDGLTPLLKSFNVDNLYSFLFANTSVKNADKLPCDELRKRAAERKKTEFYKNDSISGSGQKLCGQCELTFKDETSKKAYDNYLEYAKRKAILDEVKGVADISGELSDEQGDVFIAQLTEIFKDRKLAGDVLTAFCKVEKISYNPKDTGGGAKKLIVCRVCGCTNDASDGRKVCQNCGEALYIKCPNPKCSLTNEASIKVCKCGFKLEDLDKALALCSLAEQRIESLDFAVAQAHLTDAERYWPASSKVEALRNRLNTLATRLKPISESMRAAAAEGRYFEAQKQYESIKKLSPEFKDIDLENEIQAAVNAAAAALKAAQTATAEKDIIDHSVKAYELCKDYPGVKDLIPPPNPPTNLTAEADGNTKSNNLSWDGSGSAGLVFYTVIRKRDVVPVNISDGELLGRVSACRFNDTKIEPATSYFYAIFAERAGTESKPAVTSLPIVNLFEITGLSVTAGNSFIQVEWDTLPTGATAEIYRNNELLTATTATEYLDSGLVNDSAYSYIVKLAYHVGGQKRTTPGIAISGTPTKPPKPIDSLSIKQGDGDTFTATWSNPDSVTVELYAATEKPTYAFGDLVSQQIFEKHMRRLAIDRSSSTTATLQHKGSEMLYIVAAVIKSGSVVVGAVARASKGASVKISRIAAVNDKLNIYLDVPQGATGFVVLYRFDKFPDDISDVKTVRKYVPLKQYLHYSAIVLDTLEPKNYYFSVFAEFSIDGEKEYSVGAEQLFANAAKQNIIYSITVAKKLFGESHVVIEFESDNNTFTLPDLEIMSAIGNAPMFKDSAKHFASIPTRAVNGVLQAKIPIPKGIARDTYIKAFLQDDSLASQYQLKLKLKSNYKIT